MHRWSAHTMFDSIGPGTSLLIFEETIAGLPTNPLTVGDALNITLGGANSVMVRGSIAVVDQDSVVFSLTDRGRWRMTPRRSDEPLVGVIWTASPTQEWVIRSAA